MKKKKLIDVREFFGIKDISHESSSNFKNDSMKRYIIPVAAIELFLADKISEEGFRSVYEKYLRMDHSSADVIRELLPLAGYDIDTSQDYEHKNLFTLADMTWIQRHLNIYWKTEIDNLLHDILSSLEKKSIISKKEHATLLKAHKEFRGGKTVNKNKLAYMEIISICERDFKKKGLGEQWKNSVESYGSENKLSVPQREKLYKSFMKWKKGKTIEEMKNLLSESRLKIHPQ